MGNAISQTNNFLQSQSQQNQQTPSQHEQKQRQKPLKDKPALKEPAFEGYVAGWRQGEFDDDAQEFSFATFQKHNPNSSGYEGDDEEDADQSQAGFQYLKDEGQTYREYRDERGGGGGGGGSVRGEEFQDLGRGRGLGRSGSQRGKEVVDGSLERRLERVRQTVADEHALPRVGMGREVRVG